MVVSCRLFAENCNHLLCFSPEEPVTTRHQPAASGQIPFDKNPYSLYHFILVVLDGEPAVPSRSSDRARNPL